MRIKILNLLLILSSFIGYLEWGTEQSIFLIQGERDVLQKLVTAPTEVLHPFTILPLAGQVLLLITLFQKQPSRALTIWGMVGIGLLLVFMTFIGLISINYRIISSTLPFIVVSLLTIRELRAKH